MQTLPNELFYQQTELIKSLSNELAIEHARVEQYAEAYDHLKLQFAKLQRQHFGSKSERYIEDQLFFGDLHQRSRRRGKVLLGRTSVRRRRRMNYL